MLDLEILRQFVVFSKCGTLSAAAEEVHISQPSLTRSMQKLEEEFGICLFSRSRNRIFLTESGSYAAKRAEKFLEEAEALVRDVKAYDERLRTIALTSCAPAPLWQLIPRLSVAFPTRSITSKLADTDDVVSELLAGSCDLALLPEAVKMEGFVCIPFISEHLSLCLKAEHELASHDSLTLADLNGYNYLLLSEIGFWDRLCREHLPASRFLVQSDEFEFRTLAHDSSLPFFTTDLAHDEELVKGRKVIPITDEVVNVTYHLLLPSSSELIRLFL